MRLVEVPRPVTCVTLGWPLAGDDFDIIQQEIVMMQELNHANIVQYFGSYLRKDKVAPLLLCITLCGKLFFLQIWSESLFFF